MIFLADYSCSCEQCGRNPCVIARDPENRSTHDSKLCGPCFFRDRMMIDPELWNEPVEDTE